MSLQLKLDAASTREEYVAVLKITLHELATALCCLAFDEGLPQPFRIKFKDQVSCTHALLSCGFMARKFGLESWKHSI